MNRKAIIVSILGKKLSLKEKKMIKKYKPWGIILFKRNIKSISQLKELTSSIRLNMKDKHYPILIDEEGGIVSRLSDLISNKKFSQYFFGSLYKINRKISMNLYKNYNNSISLFLKKVGININSVPVLDQTFRYTNRIIGNRSYSNDINIIKKLGSLCIEIFEKNKISTVIKHIPGHGRARVDSHLKLPLVKTSKKELVKNDFAAFKNINSRFAMTAHVLYNDIDKKNCATHSNKIINIIRKKIKFKGIIISDDVSMKALKYDIVQNSLKSLIAGCNLALYCSGKYSESLKLLKKMPLIDNFTKKKTSEFYKFLS
jgi:beta-N-acetylhexosaminidase